MPLAFMFPIQASWKQGFRFLSIGVLIPEAQDEFESISLVVCDLYRLLRLWRKIYHQQRSEIKFGFESGVRLSALSSQQVLLRSLASRRLTVSFCHENIIELDTEREWYEKLSLDSEGAVGILEEVGPRRIFSDNICQWPF